MARRSGCAARARPGSGGGPAGDAIVTVRYAEHPLYKVSGRDLRLQLAGDALRGGARRQSARADPDRGGRSDNSGRHQFGPCLGCAARACRPLAKAAAGDLFAEIRIVLPSGEEADLAELMREWREKKPYDPRSTLG